MRLSTFSCAYWPFVYLLWKKCPFRPFAHLEIGLFVFLLLSYKSSFCVLDTTLSSDTWFASIFSHSISCLFTSWEWSTKIFKFYKEQFILFLFLLVLLTYLGIHYQIHGDEDFFKEFSFCMWCEVGVQFHSSFIYFLIFLLLIF